MFIRKRQATKSPSYQVIETYREGGKVRQRVIYNLGHHATIEAALKYKRDWLRYLTRPAKRRASMISSITAKWRAQRSEYCAKLDAAREREHAACIADLKADLANLEAVARSVKSVHYATDKIDTTSRPPIRGTDMPDIPDFLRSAR
jgi:hypothetical protein